MAVKENWLSTDINRLIPSTFGFDRFWETMHNAADAIEQTNNAFPPYNVVKYGSDEYDIEIAVAGYCKSDLEVSQEKNQLKVSAKKMECADKQYITKHIASRAFTRTFYIADTIVIKEVNLADGILTISLQNVVPESQKTRLIPITSK